ncbi:MAG: cobalamin-binding protein, partial [Krumholzibacteria bacterium]|nr:cobalamin-binding protein [Candidatus Krumholzibacteria bacterium]
FQISTAARRASAGALRGRAAVLIWKNPWMAVGGGNHIDGMLRELGLANALADRPGYPVVTLDELRSLDLELLLLPDEPWRFTAKDAAELVAGGVAPVAPCLDGKDLSWYGAWTAGGLRRLAGLVA